MAILILSRIHYSVQGAGFVNVVLNPVFLAEQVENVVADGVRPPRVEKYLIITYLFRAQPLDNDAQGRPRPVLLDR